MDSSAVIVPITVVEGFSTNTNIPCELNGHIEPLYWRINELVYDLFSVPTKFVADGYVRLIIYRVNRHMDGWAFQCFTLNDMNSQISMLTVLYSK